MLIHVGHTMSLGHHYHEDIKGWARDEIGQDKGDLDFEIYFRDWTRLVFFKINHDHPELNWNSYEML